MVSVLDKTSRSQIATGYNPPAVTPWTRAHPERSRLPRFLLVLGASALVVYIAACAFFYFFQDAMTFPAPTQYAKATPSDVGISFEDLHIPVNGSEQIHCWWIPADSASDRVVLVFHGNGYVLDQGIPGKFASDIEFIPLHRIAVNLLLVDYRGYGSSSPGVPNEKRVFEDARAAFAYLRSQRKIESRHIVLLGRSFGTGPATQLAVEHPDAGGLILISPFTSVPDAAKAISYLNAFPIRLLSHNRFDNLSKIASVRIPVFIAVGTLDDLTPPAMAQALFQKANEPKRLYLVPEAGHNSVINVGGEALLGEISAFLETLR
jgi:fermentation-respiration switch protein FrsA (DUF1100 family)